MRVFYTGVGCHPSGKHTEQEFIAIMKKLFIHSRNGTVQRFKHWTLPYDFIHFTLIDWVDYSGANLIN